MTFEEITTCIDLCVESARECERCTNACLGEPDVSSLTDCIRLTQDCAHVCWTTASLLGRHSRFLRDICRLCGEVCEACSVECRRFSHEHNQRCADLCDECAEECRRLAGVPV